MKGSVLDCCSIVCNAITFCPEVLEVICIINPRKYFSYLNISEDLISARIRVMSGDSLMLDILHPKGIHRCCLPTTKGSATRSTQTKHGTSISERRGKEQEEMQGKHGKKRCL